MTPERIQELLQQADRLEGQGNWIAHLLACNVRESVRRAIKENPDLCVKIPDGRVWPQVPC